MKKIILLFLLVIGFCCCYQYSNAQLLKRMKSEVKNRVDNHVVKKSGDAADAAMKETEEAGSDIVKGKSSEKNTSENEVDKDSTSGNMGATNQPAPTEYKNYDFVPGDKIIFAPDLFDESDQELPERFIINRGNSEIQTFEGTKILHLDKGSHVSVTPLMNSDSYLPEQFTIEMDVMYENPTDKFSFNIFSIEFRKPGDKNFSATPPHNLIVVANDQCEWGDVSTSRVDLPSDLKKSMNTNNVWHHIAIYVRKNIGKGYIDQYRVAASNTMPAGLGFMDIRTDGNYGYKIKNVRIAAGGDDKYNKIITEGKFVTHGILFDVNKSTIKPESMGTLNEVAKMMKNHEALKLEIDGYTDSDGNEDANIKLSQSRADAVKNELVKIGIEADRLDTKGYGETKPMDSNETAEGKANNRRVEFVKI